MAITATELKSRLGEHLERARLKPVEIQKSGRRYAVLVSVEDYDRWQALEDRYWGEKAIETAKDGYLTPEETMESIRRRLAEIG